MPQVRDNGTFHLTVIESMPIDALEKRVRLDSLTPTRDVPKPLRRIDGAKSADQVVRFRGHSVRIPDPAFHDPVEKSIASLEID